MTAAGIALQFRIGAFVFERNLAGITHEESLTPPQPAGNTLNWVVGHIVSARNQTLQLIGGTPLFDQAEFVGYGANRPAGAPVLELDELRRRFHALGPELEKAITSLTEVELGAPAAFSPTGNPDETLGTLLQSLVFHEAYHLGQTGTLRRLLGRRGALLGPGEAAHA